MYAQVTDMHSICAYTHNARISLQGTVKMVFLQICNIQVKICFKNF